MATLSVCMICKNEEKCIGEALQSVQHLADEVIIVDTGSTDGTREVARQYTQNVYEMEWCDDFSRARNVALSYASQEWILIIDCDEVLAPVSIEVLQAYLRDESAEAYCVTMKLTEGKDRDEQMWMCRLLRNKPAYRYKNRLHEQIVHSIPTDRLKPSALVIYHKGYEPEILVKKDKLTRNVHILSQYTESEKDCFYYYCLGNVYGASGDYQQAVGAYLEALRRFEDPYGFAESLICNLCEGFYQLKAYEEVLRLYQSFEKILQNHTRVLWCIEQSRRQVVYGIYTGV